VDTPPAVCDYLSPKKRVGGACFEDKLTLMGGFGMSVSLLGLLLVAFSNAGKSNTPQVSDKARPDVRGIGVVLIILGLIIAWL
jgi:hypothetical protein